MKIEGLSFKRDGKVFWNETHCGTIEPLRGSFKWGYIPEQGIPHIPNILRRPVFYNTQREIKAALQRPFLTSKFRD